MKRPLRTRTHLVNAYVPRLRRKLASTHGSDDSLIETIRGVG
ncbi:MAG: winged helix-turn-helix domain-containing protein [Verrucomicrobia bacterium]|nr:winged helix-turn-helix domain-containing protein [Verrucomicrobiota bacterium]